MIIHTFPQYSDEWWQARLGIPTASRFSDFITPAKGDYSRSAPAYQAELIAERILGESEDQERFKPSYWMERGTILEPEARRAYEFETGLDTRAIGLVENNGAGASLDFMVGDKGGGEIKCHGPKKHVLMLMNGELPAEHKPQVHGHIVVAELDWCDTYLYCPGLPSLLVRTVRDEYTEKVADHLARFLRELNEAEARILNKEPTS